MIFGQLQNFKNQGKSEIKLKDWIGIEGLNHIICASYLDEEIKTVYD
jgi:hypothetical protein